MAVVRADALRSVAFGSITGSFTALGTALTHTWRMFKITNTTDKDMIISFDGTTNNLIVPAGSFTLYDIATNAPPVSENDNLLVGIGTQFYVKYVAAPSSGTIYLEGLYAKGE